MARAEATKIVKRRQNRIAGVFIDGTGLDRAARRLNKRVDMAALLRGVTAGINPAVARYYTIIPYEDDSRHRSYLDAVQRAGLSVCVKRLPPKGVTRQVSTDVEMAGDIVAFSLGRAYFPDTEHSPEPQHSQGASALPHILPGAVRNAAAPESTLPTQPEDSVVPEEGLHTQRVVIVVCPARDLAYPIALAREFGADTVSADFGHFRNDDILKSAAKWIDLSDSETIWKE